MIDNLPILTYPNWLKTITAESMAKEEFPLRDILTNDWHSEAGTRCSSTR